MPNESDRGLAETIVEVALHNPGDPARKLEAAILLVNEEDPLYRKEEAQNGKACNQTVRTVL